MDSNSLLPYVNEIVEIDSVLPEQLDDLLAEGWRHFGTSFFRYNIGSLQGEPRLVLPLRVSIPLVTWSRSFRRVIAKMSGFQLRVNPTELTENDEHLFLLHAARFKENPPDSLSVFLSGNPSHTPCHNLAFRFSDGDRLVAASFLDIGRDSVSSVYAMFHPDYARYRLGIATMIAEIEYAGRLGKQFYYPGYAYLGESFYDYKKQLPALSFFNWQGAWLPIAKTDTWLKELFKEYESGSHKPE